MFDDVLNCGGEAYSPLIIDNFDNFERLCGELAAKMKGFMALTNEELIIELRKYLGQLVSDDLPDVMVTYNGVERRLILSGGMDSTRLVEQITDSGLITGARWAEAGDVAPGTL